MSATGVVTIPSVVFTGLSGGYFSVIGEIVFPTLTIQSAETNTSGEVTLPSLLIAGTSHTQSMGCSGSIVLPNLYFSGLTVGAQGGLILPGINVSGVGHGNSLASGGVTLGRIIALGTATPGQRGAGYLSLPVFQLAGTTHHVPAGVGTILLPMITISGEGFAISGVVPAIPYRTVVVNTKHSAISEYLNYNFDSFCEFPEGVFLAAGPSGLFRLYSAEGTDNGDLINSELEFGTTDFGEQTKKNCTDGYINYRGDGVVEINALADELKDPDVYSTYDVADSRLRNYKFKMSKFREGKNWRFSVKNVEGSNLDINEVAVFYDVLSRRI